MFAGVHFPRLLILHLLLLLTHPLCTTLYLSTIHIHGLARRTEEETAAWARKLHCMHCVHHPPLLAGCRSVGRLLVVVGGLGLHSIRSTEGHSRGALALKHNKLIIVINILPLSWHPLERISCLYGAGTVANHPPRYPDYDEQMTARSYWEVVGRPRPQH